MTDAEREARMLAAKEFLAGALSRFVGREADEALRRELADATISAMRTRPDLFPPSLFPEASP